MKGNSPGPPIMKKRDPDSNKKNEMRQSNSAYPVELLEALENCVIDKIAT